MPHSYTVGGNKNCYNFSEVFGNIYQKSWKCAYHLTQESHS